MKIKKLKGILMIDLIIVLSILGVLITTILGFSIGYVNLSKGTLKSLLINYDNKHFKTKDDYTLYICNIKTEGTIGNYQIIDTNCIEKSFFIPIFRNNSIDFYKVAGIFVNQNLQPIEHFTRKGIFEIKNGVLFLQK